MSEKSPTIINGTEIACRVIYKNRILNLSGLKKLENSCANMLNININL